jgi:uncharacterized protein (TIGR00369 family)
MQSREKPKLDEAVARRAFDKALASYEQDFGKFFLARLFGCEFEYTEDTCRVSFELKDFMLNPQGGLHGGVTAFVLDISMGHLLWKKSGPGTTLEMKVQYAAPARAGRLTATSRFIRHGRGISYLRAELVDDKGELIAFATSTWKSLSKPVTK